MQIDNVIESIFDRKIIPKISFNEHRSDTVFVYLVNIDNCLQHIDQFWQYLLYEEKERAKKYCSKMLTDKYIVSHAILKLVLSFYTSKNPLDIRFVYNNYGKPFIKNSNIYFNMSHSNNIACYILALNCNVGIDIEFENNNFNIQEVYKLAFTAEEISFLENLEKHKKLKTFYNFWTRKEAIVKLLGQGLFYPINTIEVISLFSDNKVRLSKTGNSLVQTLYCNTLEILPEYSITIATEYKMHKVIYLKMNDEKNIFDSIKVEYLN